MILFQIDELETNFINERESFAKTQLELREMMRELTEDWKIPFMARNEECETIEKERW